MSLTSVAHTDIQDLDQHDGHSQLLMDAHPVAGQPSHWEWEGKEAVVRVFGNFS